MPFYEYECSNCKFYVEAMQKISDEPLKKCPSCGQESLVKLISAPVFRLKGGGWYETDFKGDKESKRNLAGSGSGESGEAGEAGEKASKDKLTKTRAAKPAAKRPAVARKKAPAGNKVKVAAVRKRAKAPARKVAKKPVKKPVKRPPAKGRRVVTKAAKKKTARSRGKAAPRRGR